MDLRKIRTLLQLMDENQLAEMELEEEGMKIKFSKFGNQPAFNPGMMPVMPSLEAASALSPAVESKKPESEEVEGKVISSPMPGTFYAASAPEKPPFIQVGDMVTEDTVVCIIEAMKVMNEIKAECHGKIVEILVNNADPVEYGKPLFRIV